MPSKTKHTPSVRDKLKLTGMDGRRDNSLLLPLCFFPFSLLRCEPYTRNRRLRSLLAGPSSQASPSTYPLRIRLPTPDPCTAQDAVIDVGGHCPHTTQTKPSPSSGGGGAAPVRQHGHTHVLDGHPSYSLFEVFAVAEVPRGAPFAVRPTSQSLLQLTLAHVKLEKTVPIRPALSDQPPCRGVCVAPRVVNARAWGV